MSVPARRPRNVRPSRGDLTPQDLKAILWPIVKRLPAYVRLAWALVREPAIPRRYKTLLYTTAVYTFSPLHLVASPIPVVGQADSVVLLLMGLRQALAHCPPQVKARHLARLKISPGQMDKDLRATMGVAWYALGEIGRPVTRNVRFAGRVAGGFSRRLVYRIRDEGRGKRER